MAEAFLQKHAGDVFEAESAGLEAGSLNPIVVEVMREIGIDISRNKIKEVFQFLKQGKSFHYVIMVCDEASAERCPIFPGVVRRIHWNFPDPSKFSGTHESKLSQSRVVRDMIKAKVLEFIEQETTVRVHGTTV